VSAEEARQLYQVRSALEALAGRLFVQNATKAQRTALVRAQQRIARLAGLHARVSVLRALSLSVPGRSVQAVAEMQAIVDAVLADDAEAAARACSRHVEEAGRAGLQALAAQQG
jgi:GntR family transcriptional regulator, trigonelline degradation regulator